MKNINKTIQMCCLSVLAFFGFTASTNAQCAAGEVEYYILVDTDDYGYEAYWEIVPSGNACGTGTLISGGNAVVGCAGGGAQVQDPGGYGNNIIATEGPVCLTIGQSYDLIAVDDWGDGGTCFTDSIPGGVNGVSLGNACMPGGSANDTFTFVATAPVSEDLAIVPDGREYTRIPLHQTAAHLNLDVELSNNGATNVTDATVTSTIYEASNMTTPVYTITSPAQTVNAGASVMVSNGTYTPAVAGDYVFYHTFSTAQITDGNNGNDTATYTIEVDATFARDDDNWAGGSLGIGAGATANGILGQNFEIAANADLDSIQIFIANGAAGNTMVGQPVSVSIYNTSATSEPTTLLANTDTVTVTTTGPHWISLPISGGNLSLTPDEYFFGAVEADSNLTLGTTSGIFTAGKGWVEWATNPAGTAPWSNSEEFGFSVAYMLRLHFAPNQGCVAPTATITVDSDVLCNGGADGSLTAAATGGTAPYTYVWNNAATTATVSGLGAGSYDLTVTDATGCTVSSSATVAEPTAISVSATVTDASTAGGTDGAIDITVSGGTAPYTFLWDNAATTEDLSGLAAGSYTGTITDANGCTTSATVDVQDGPTSVVINVNDLQIDLFPNPTKGQVALSLNLPLETDVNIRVSNVTGQTIREINDNNVMNKTYELDLREYAAGVYMVRISAFDKVITKRLIIK